MGIEPQRLKFVTDYLLGQLSQEDRDRFEDQYFTDNDVFIELLEVEDKLISSYLHGQLPPHEHQLFEQLYLNNPCKRQKVEFASLLNQPEARQLLQGKSEAATQNNSSLLVSIFAFFSNWPSAKPLAVVALLVLIGAFFWPARRYFSTKAPTEVVITNSQTPTVQPTENRANLEGRQVVSLHLAPGAQRSGSNESRVAYKELGTRVIELKLKLVGYIYPKYTGRLQRLDEGKEEIERNDSLLPESSDNQKIVVWKLEAAKLPAGDYQVELKGLRSVGDLGEMSSYDFNVRSR